MFSHMRIKHPMTNTTTMLNDRRRIILGVVPTVR